jgi:hypothetical protein
MGLLMVFWTRLFLYIGAANTALVPLGMSRKATIPLIVLSILMSCQNAENDSNAEERSHAGRNQDDDDDCGVEDGIQSATIEYFNPKTGYSATYSLNVEVENCQVVQIDFNNGGYLDGDHIEPADIDENGDATIEDDRGRNFEVHIQK